MLVAQTYHFMNRKSSLQSLGLFLVAVFVLSVILGYLFSESFRITERFDIAPKPGIANPSGLEDLTAVSVRRYPPTFHTRQTRHSVPKFPRPSRSRSVSWGRRLG